MVTSRVIEGNALGERRDCNYLRALLALGAELQPVRFDPKRHRAAFEGFPSLVMWEDQRTASEIVEFAPNDAEESPLEERNGLPGASEGVEP